MPRIRTIKPEFWDSPSTAAADLAVRLTYIAMWNWADDSGRGTANMKELEAFVFPNDDVSQLPRRGAGVSGGSRGNSAPSAGKWRSFAEICGEVAEAYGVRFYRVNGRPYYLIPAFKVHQSKDFRAKSKYPTEDEGVFFDVTSENTIEHEGIAGVSGGSRGNSAPSAGTSAVVRGKNPAGTGEQGNRGTGEGERPSKVYPQPVDNSEQGSTPSFSPRDETTQPPWVRGTPDDPRCPQHEHLQKWDVPKCHDCAKARQWFQHEAQEQQKAAKQRSQQRRDAINACPHCDQNGLRETPEGTLTRCNHKENQQ